MAQTDNRPSSPKLITFDDEGHLVSPQHIVFDEDQEVSPEHNTLGESRSVSPEHIAVVESRIIEIVKKQIAEYTFDFNQPFINEIYYKYNFEKIFQIESDPLVEIIGSAVVANDASILNT